MLWVLKTTHKEDVHAASAMGNSMRRGKQRIEAACLGTLVLVLARKFFLLPCEGGGLVPAPSFTQGGGYEDQTRLFYGTYWGKICAAGG